MRLFLQTLAALAVFAASADPAAANGRPPTTVKVLFRPGSTQEMVLGTTFGFLITKDNGITWRWGCDSVVGIMGTFDPDYELTSTGLMLGTSNDGIFMSRDGCHWTKPSGPLSTGTTSSISVASSGDIWATLTDPVGGYKVFRSIDDGASFQESTGLPPSDWWDTIEVAPSDPERIYLTGFQFTGVDPNPKRRILVRSRDGGDSWEELPTTSMIGTKHSDLKIAGIHPTNPDIVFLRMTLTATTLQETIYKSSNAGDVAPTWTEVLRKNDFLSGLAVRSTGDVYVVQTNLQKLLHSPNGDAFEEVPDVNYQSQCIAERPGDQQLFMCMNNLIGDNGIFHLARSATGQAGAWTGVLRFPDIVGPVRCEPGTLQHDDCEVNLWCGQKEQLAITSDEIECAVEVDAGVEPQPVVDDGCCSSGRRPGLELAAVALLLLPRRRRRTN